MAGLQRVVFNLGVPPSLGNCPDGQEDTIWARENVGSEQCASGERTNLEGLCAVGDPVYGLHQIAVGTGHAAVAATHIHNSLPRKFR
jgi:thioredoxin reductase